MESTTRRVVSVLECRRRRGRYRSGRVCSISGCITGLSL